MNYSLSFFLKMKNTPRFSYCTIKIVCPIKVDIPLIVSLIDSSYVRKRTTYSTFSPFKLVGLFFPSLSSQIRCCFVSSVHSLSPCTLQPLFVCFFICVCCLRLLTLNTLSCTTFVGIISGIWILYTTFTKISDIGFI